jgi:hypothetical protein
MRALLTAAFWVLPALAYAAPPGIDGNDPFSPNNAGAVTLTKTITTTLPNDVIVLGSGTQSGAAPVTVVGPVTGCGLTWALRKARSTTSTCRGGLTNPCSIDAEIWWAQAPAPLGGCTVTVNYSAPMDQGGIGWMGVSGTATPAAPWDTNVSLPASNVGLSSVPNLGPASTDAQSYRLVSLAVIGRNTLEHTPCYSAPQWFSSPLFMDQRHSASLENTGSSLAQNGKITAVSTNYYESSAAVCPAGDSTPAGDNWIVIMDALVGPFTAPGGTRAQTHIME